MDIDTSVPVPDVNEKSFTRLTLRVQCFLKPGQFLGVVGFKYQSLSSLLSSSSSFPTMLGKNNEGEFIRLYTSKSSFPLWTTSEPIVLFRGEKISYKYCLIEGGNIKSFETVTNRSIEASEKEIEINDEVDSAQFEQSLKIDLDYMTQKSKLTDEEISDIYWNRILDRKGRLILVCYHLPVIINRTSSPERPFEAIWAESLIAKTKESISSELPTIWVGTISMSLKNLTHEEKEYITAMLSKMDCIPVFIEDQLADKAYNGFCKNVMWPVFHNVDQIDQIHAVWNFPNDLTTDISLDENFESKMLQWNTKSLNDFIAFKSVTEIFAEIALDIVRDGDIVWVHDYHLILLPSLLRPHINSSSQVNNNYQNTPFNPTSKNNNTFKLFSNVKIVFFLHIPFPTTQIFRTLPQAKEILEAMVSADLIGFHAFDHARHFLNVSKSVLGLISSRTSGRMTLKLNKKSYREILITMSHVSIETNNIDDIIKKNFDQILRKIIDRKNTVTSREINGNGKENIKKIILSLDVSQRLSGISLKFFGYEKFLLDYFSLEKEKIMNDILLIQKNIKQNSRKEDEKTTSIETKSIIQILKKNFSHLVENNDDRSNKIETDDYIYRSYFSSSSFSISDSSSEDQEPGSFSSPSSSPIPSINFDSLSINENNFNDFSLIDFEEVKSKNFLLSQRILLYLISDVFLLTPIREGLNLMPLEYLYSRYIFQKRLKEYLKENNLSLNSTSSVVLDRLDIICEESETSGFKNQLKKDVNNNKELLNHLLNPGCVVVSEFSTCASLLNGALKVNPFDSSSISDAIMKSINMNRKESEYRRQRDLPFISSHPASLWTKNILCELELFSCNLQKENDLSLRNHFNTTNFLNYYKSFGSSKSTLDNQSNKSSSFKNLYSKVFIFDYGGVIISKNDFGEYKKDSLVAINGKKPSEVTFSELKKLSENRENVVLVLTGLPREKIISLFKDLPYVSLASTSGFIYSWGKNLSDTSIFSSSTSSTSLSNSSSFSSTLSNSSSYNTIPSFPSTTSLPNNVASTNMPPSPPIMTSASSSSIVPPPPFPSNLSPSSGMHTSMSFINSHPFAQSFPSMYFPQPSNNQNRPTGMAPASNTVYQQGPTSYQQSPQMSYPSQPPLYYSLPSPPSPLTHAPSNSYFLLPPPPKSNFLTDFLAKGLASNDERKWEMFPNNIDWFEVRTISDPIITRYTFRTNGSCKIPRFPGIGWSYFFADQEWGQHQSEQIVLELEAALSSHDIRIASDLVPGTIEVLPKNFSKYKMIELFLQKVFEKRGGSPPSLIFSLNGEGLEAHTHLHLLHALKNLIVSSSFSSFLSTKLFLTCVGTIDNSLEPLIPEYFTSTKEVEEFLVRLNKEE